MKPVIAIACNLEFYNGRQKVSVNRNYTDSLLAAGGLPMVVPLTLNDEARSQYLGQCQGLLLPGGIDVLPDFYGAQPEPNLGPVDPLLDSYQIGLIQEAMEQKLPILAICRGHQLLNVVLGGTLIQHIPQQAPWLNHNQDMEPRWPFHSVMALAGSKIADVFGEKFQVNSFHHQAVDRPAPSLKVTATAPDGVVEALEHQDHPFVVGVQWHPEGMWNHSPETLKFFCRFVEACERGRQ